MKALFGDSHQVNFFHIEPRTFPRTTLNVISVDEVIRHGIMPVGIKTETEGKKELKILNIGFLDPGDDTNFKAVVQAFMGKPDRARYKGVDRYLLLPDQFVRPSGLA